MAKAPLKGEPLSAALALVKMIVPLAPLAFGLFSRIRRAACWPTRNALNAELRIVSNAMFGVDDPLAKDAGNPSIDVVHDEGGRSKLTSDALEQKLHGSRIAGIARVSPHTVGLLESVQDRLVRISGGDGDAHALSRKQPCAA